jgi:hypothetical protein
VSLRELPSHRTQTNANDREPDRLSDANDDHYVPNLHNAHIDTRAFEAQLIELAQGRQGQELDYADLWPRIHELVMGRLAGAVEQPPADALICRYLSATKYLWFLPRLQVNFGSAREFEDPTDCAIPADYTNCIQRFFLQRHVTPVAWDDYADRFRSRWLVSSWTEITDYHDDHLLWHRYAGGPTGVGLTIRYGELHELIRQASSSNGLTDFLAGRVSYGSPLKMPPFSKRRTFRNEKEVRFVVRGEALSSIRISLESVRSRIGLRFSPDASRHHIEATRETWLRWGGSDRYQIGGE